MPCPWKRQGRNGPKSKRFALSEQITTSLLSARAKFVFCGYHSVAAGTWERLANGRLAFIFVVYFCRSGEARSLSLSLHRGLAPRLTKRYDPVEHRLPGHRIFQIGAEIAEPFKLVAASRRRECEARLHLSR
jgi:hypothetical protein